MAGLTTMDLLFNQLKIQFGSEFVMEYPGRVLDPDTYAFTIDGIYGEVTKPQPVVEEEFRLTDGGFRTTDDIVGGPDGGKVSHGYELALNQLLPLINDQDATFMKDRAAVRTWLLTWVPGPDLGDDTHDSPPEQTRLHVYQLLLNRYETALSEWRTRKTSKLQAAMDLTGDERTAALEAYSRWLAEDGAAEETRVEALFTDCVVKGCYHEVRACLAFLDVKSAAEALAEAKATLRNAGLLSLDESETIYPVQLQPEDWVSGLATDMSPVDLLLDPQSMMLQLTSKQSQLQQLEEQYALLSSIPTGDPAALRQKVTAAQNALDQANGALVNSYEAAVGSVAKMYIQAEGAALNAAEKADLGALIEKETGCPVTTEDVDKIVAMAADVNAKQTALTEASRDLTDALAAVAQATVTDQSSQLATLRSQMAGLRTDIQGLEAILGTTAATRVLTKSFKAGTAEAPGSFDPSLTPSFQALKTAAPATPPPAAALLPAGKPVAGNWIDVILHTDSSVLAKATTAGVKAASTSFDVDLLFGSASGASQSNSADQTANISAQSTTIDIGMRCMKVEVDRGWLNDDVISATNAYCQLHGSGSLTAALPSVPTGFLIAKDVTIKIDITSMSSDQKSHFDASSSSAGGGFLCFSVASSSSSQNSSASSQMAQDGTTAVIRIPQPQILGWFVASETPQSLPTYQPLPADYLQATDPPAPVGALPPASRPAVLGSGVPDHPPQIELEPEPVASDQGAGNGGRQGATTRGAGLPPELAFALSTNPAPAPTTNGDHR